MYHILLPKLNRETPKAKHGLHLLLSLTSPAPAPTSPNADPGAGRVPTSASPVTTDGPQNVLGRQLANRFYAPCPSPPPVNATPPGQAREAEPLPSQVPVRRNQGSSEVDDVLKFRPRGEWRHPGSRGGSPTAATLASQTQRPQNPTGAPPCIPRSPAGGLNAALLQRQPGHILIRP